MKRLFSVSVMLLGLGVVVCLTWQSAWSIENGRYAWISRDFHASSVRSLSMSADGNLFVFSSVEAFPETHDTNGMIDVYLWDRITDKLVGVSHTGAAMTGGYEPIISPNGQYVLYHDLNGVIMIYTVSTDTMAVLTDFIGQTYSSSINSVSANGKYLIVETESQESILFNIQAKTHVPVTDPVDGLLPNWGNLRSTTFHGNYVYYAYNSGYAVYDIVADDVQILAGTTEHPWYGEIVTVSPNGEGVLFQTGNTSGAPCSGYYLWKLSLETYQCVDIDFSEDNTVDNIYFDLSGETNRYLLATGTIGGGPAQHSTLYDLETDTKTVIGAGYTIWQHSPFAADTNAFLFQTTDQIDPEDSSGSLDYYLYEFDDTLIQTETPTVTPTSTATSTPDASPTPTPTPTPEGFDVKEDAWSFENAGYDITWDHFRAAFGDAQTMDSGVPKESARQLFQDAKIESMAKGGLCFGFNLTTSKLFADLPQGFSLPSDYTEYEMVHDVPSPGYSFGSLQKGVLGDYLATYFLYSQGTEFATQYAQNQNLSYAQIESRIKSSIDGDMKDPLLLNIYYVPAFPWPLNYCVAHVVTPFKYTEDVTGMNVFVYDSNYPDEEKKLRLSKDGTWGYEGWSSTQECRLKTFNPASPEYHTKPILVPISSSTVAGTPTLFPEHGSEVASIMSLTNAWIYPQEGMFLTLPLNGISDSVHRTLIVTDTGRISATVFYTDGVSSNIGIASPDAVMSVETIDPTYGTPDVVAYASEGAYLELTAGSTLTRTISTILSEDDAEKATRLTCSYPDSSMTSLASDMTKSVIAVSEALDHCRLVVNEDVELAYTLPSLPSGSTVTLAVQPDQSLSVGIDTDGDGSVDTEILVEHEDTTRYLYLPMIER